MSQPSPYQPPRAPKPPMSKRRKTAYWAGGVFAGLVVIGAIGDATGAGNKNTDWGTSQTIVAVGTASASHAAASSPAVSKPSSPLAAPHTSAAAVKPKPSSPAAPSVTTSDNPAFDLTGSGDACRMHYFQQDGQTVTLFDLATAGELITHVSGPDYSINRHDQQMTAGISRFTYGFPLAQATDMGAVLYLPDGTSQSCTISAGTSAP